ncbi:MAG: exodeoxyribonuclease VII small subunit [Pseudomonadota bacterium]
MTEKEQDISEMNFEQALDKLEAIVEALEQGNVPLDQSISYYERGEELRKHCRTLLSSAESRVEKIRLDAEGKAAGTEPLDQ